MQHRLIKVKILLNPAYYIFKLTLINFLDVSLLGCNMQTVSLTCTLVKLLYPFFRPIAYSLTNFAPESSVTKQTHLTVYSHVS